MLHVNALWKAIMDEVVEVRYKWQSESPVWPLALFSQVRIPEGAKRRMQYLLVGGKYVD